MFWVRRIDPIQRVVFITLSGSYSLQDTLAGQRSLSFNPEFAPDFRALFDFRGITDMELSSSEMHEIAKNSPFDKGGSRAVVARRDIINEMTSLGQTFQDEDAPTFKVFEDMTEALKWLGLD